MGEEKKQDYFKLFQLDRSQEDKFVSPCIPIGVISVTPRTKKEDQK